jgi:hypothetical protein
MQFSFDSNQWKEEWKIWDFVECQKLDIHGEFLTNLTSVTDLNRNNLFETTIVYQTLCTGDMSPKNTKVIMREGRLKYAVRGESLVTLGRNVKYGGVFKTDEALNEVPEFRAFLIQKWKLAAGVQ